MKADQCRYDIQGFARELDMEVSEIAGLFSSYFEEMQSEILEMKVLLDRQDWYMLERVVHNIKGVSANLNICDVFEEAALFNDKLRKSCTENAKGHVDKISQLIGCAELEIKNFFNGMNITI